MRQTLTLLKSIEFLINHVNVKTRNYSSSKNLSFVLVHQLHYMNQSEKADESMDNHNNKGHKKRAKGANRQNWRKRSSTSETSEDLQRFCPTHFAAIQVDDPVIVDKFRQIQKGMLETEVDVDGLESKFKTSMVSARKLHFTLEVFQLRKDNKEDLEKAKLALGNFWEKMQEELSTDPPEMKIEGISHFNNKVIFAQLQNPQTIEKIAHAMRSELIVAGLKTEEGRGFKPHLTIAKLSKDPSLFRKKIKKFPQDLWIKMKDETFGVQKFKGVQLLSMVDPKDPETGYYHEIDSKKL